MINKELHNKKVILETLKHEIEGDIEATLKHLHPDYSMTWVYEHKDGVRFPAVNFKNMNLREVYAIKGREYKIKHLISEGDVVIAELVESYPDPKTGKVYRTPLVIVWEFEDGKIKTGRHYCDPQLSYLSLTPEQIEKIFK